MRPDDRARAGDALVAFYTEALGLLDASPIEFLVGGTFAYSCYTGIDRDTKDLDVFVRPSDVARTLALFANAGFPTELPFPHWLGKVHRDGFVMDVVFNSGNGVSVVDDQWFAHAPEAEVLGTTHRLCPPEEMIWSKSFVQERERFDGADVLHLLRATARRLDWPRLLARFGSYWPVLLGQLVMFRFVYPDQRDLVPAPVVDDLIGRLAAQREEPDNRVCFGTLLSREQYLFEVEQLGYLDARLLPDGTMSRGQIQIWTDAIGRKD